MRLRLLAAVTGILAVSASVAAAASLGGIATSLLVTRQAAGLMPITAVVDLKPESLELRSRGEPVTAFVELPPGADVGRIDGRSLRLCRTVETCPAGVPIVGRTKLGDADGDGIGDLKVTFDRAGVIGLLSGLRPPTTTVLVVTGLIGTGAWFAGSDTIRLVDP